MKGIINDLLKQPKPILVIQRFLRIKYKIKIGEKLLTKRKKQNGLEIYTK